MRYARRERVLWRRSGDAVVLLPADGSQVFTLEGSGVDLWQLLAEPIALDLLDVGFVVRDSAPVSGLNSPAVAAQGPWTLIAVPNAPPRASVVTTWTGAASPGAALSAILRPGFDPEREAVVENASVVLAASNAGGTAVYQQQGAQRARVVVDASAPAVVVIRNAYDPGWRARVDGRSSPVFPADAIDQGVVVPAGHHVIELSYVDPSIGYGLFGSGLALVALAIGAALLQWRQ